MVTDPCFCRAMEWHVTLQWQHMLGHHHCSRWHQWLLTSAVSLPFIHYLLALLNGPGISEYLRSSLKLFQECYVPLMHYGTKKGSSWAWSLPHPRLLWHMTGTHFRLATCPGPMTTVWWSSRAFTSQMSPEWPHTGESPLSQAHSCFELPTEQPP